MHVSMVDAETTIECSLSSSACSLAFFVDDANYGTCNGTICISGSFAVGEYCNFDLPEDTNELFISAKGFGAGTSDVSLKCEPYYEDTDYLQPGSQTSSFDLPVSEMRHLRMELPPGVSGQLSCETNAVSGNLDMEVGVGVHPHNLNKYIAYGSRNLRYLGLPWSAPCSTARPVLQPRCCALTRISFRRPNWQPEQII